MSFDMTKIAVEVANGLSIVCASCVKFWKAKDAGLSTCLAQKPCTGPVGGGDFPEYQGPLSPERFRQWCFACGADSDHLVTVFGKERELGVCRRHLSLFGSDLSHVFIRVNGIDIPVHQLFEKQKRNQPRTLSQIIQETEAEFGEDS